MSHDFRKWPPVSDAPHSHLFHRKEHVGPDRDEHHEKERRPDNPTSSPSSGINLKFMPVNRRDSSSGGMKMTASTENSLMMSFCAKVDEPEGRVEPGTEPSAP